MKRILIITTGGTIDKSYLETKEILKNERSLIKKIIKKIRHFDKVDLKHFIKVDSREITDIHREEILQIIKANQTNYDCFLITHGTDTLVESAKFIQAKIQQLDKNPQIILTGAMRPYSVKGSDGLQNITESLFAFELLKNQNSAERKSVYIVMHGQIYNPENTKKNYQKMCFEVVK